MKLPLLFTALALGTAASFSPGHALAVGPCDSYACLAGMAGVGTGGGPACSALVQPFFKIIIYDMEGIDFPATAGARRMYLGTCTGANVGSNATILNTIIAKYGMVIE